MALTDVAEALTDPDFVDQLILQRNPQTVSAGGMASIGPQISTFYGVTTNARGDVLERGGDAERIEGTRFLVTKTKLIAGAPGITADIVTIRGRQYTVTEVQDYSNFGAGFYQATCALLPLSG